MRSTTPASKRNPARTVAFRALVAALSVILLSNSVACAEGVAADPVKLKQTLTKRGIGKGIKVKELDGTTVTGTIIAINDDGLGIAPAKAVQPITVQYTQVASVSNTGMGKPAKVAIGVAIGVGAFCTAIIVAALVAFK